MTSPAEVDEVAAAMAVVAAEREAQRVEWGTYVATEPIFILGVRAANEGDPIPVQHVERGIVPLDKVRKVAADKTSVKKG